MRIWNRALAASLLSLIACGSDGDHFSLNATRDVDERSSSSADAVPAHASADATAQVKVCGGGASSDASSALGFQLAGETYATHIAPIVTAKCARCHAGDPAMQNSTTCAYLEKNIDNVIQRLQNGVAAEATRVVEAAKDPAGTPAPLSNNQIRDQYARSVWPMQPVGSTNTASQKVTQADVDVFLAWKDVANKCAAGSTPDDALPTPSVYTDDDEQAERLLKIFQSEDCRDGPSVTDARAHVESLLTLPADSASAFYDYEKREFVPGATKMTENCTIDYFIKALAPIPEASEVLKSYKEYGWWTVQCAIVDGRPQAYLAHAAEVATSLGDKTYGLFLKQLKIVD